MAETATPPQQEPAALLFNGKEGAPVAEMCLTAVETCGTFCNDALPPSAIRALMASASRGFLTNSKRGHRIFRKVAGAVCRRAREELGGAGLLWSKAAWDGSLHAAMSGLKEFAGTADAALHQGFEKVLTSSKQAHLEGLRRPASASRKARKTAASPAATKKARPPAGGASRKARKASPEPLASYLFGDKVPHSLLCGECSNPATCAVRGGKGSNLKYFCGVHREVTGCFKIEGTREEWARNYEEYKLKAELARALDEESRLRGNWDCDGWHESGYWGDATPKSRHLIAKLLIMGGIESNPGPSSIEASPEGERLSASGGNTPASDGGVAGAPHPHDAATIACDANDAPEALTAHAEVRMDLRASCVGTKRPLEQVLPQAGPSGGRMRRLFKVSELVSRAQVDHAAENVDEPAPDARAREAGELEEDLGETSERGAGSRRNGRKARKERVVAAFFADCEQRRAAWAAREEEEMCGPPSPTTQHDSAMNLPDLEASETDDVEAQERESSPGAAHPNASLEGVPPGGEPRAQADLPLHDVPRTRAAMESTAAPSAGDIGLMVQNEGGEARASTSAAPKTGRPAQKKRRKRAESNSVPMDEAAREAGRAAAAAHLQAVGALRPSRTQREGQAVHQTELGDFGGPPDAPAVGLVTDAPIQNVGALVDRLNAKRDAEEAAAREERLKRYGRARPLGAPRGTGDALASTMEQDPSPSSPLPSVVLPSREEDSALSAEQTPTGAPSSPAGEDGQPPSPPTPSPAGHPPSPPLADQPEEPSIIAPPPLENAQPEVVPSQPPAAAPSPSPTHQEQPPVDQALAADPPNQPRAADTSRPATAEPSAEPSSALPPTEPPAQLLGDPPQAASVEDSGPGWCKKLVEALRQRRANGRAIVVAEDVPQEGAKRYGSFKDVAALVAHRRSLGLFAHLYELIQDDACWRIYFDLDFSLPTEDPSDFERRLEAFHLVRNRFLTSVLNVPEGALRFQACEAHGPARPPKQEFKYSVHEVLEGFCLRGLEARRAFGKAFGCFLENPPDDLKPSIELLRKDGGSAYIWDGSVYGQHRCFRMLRSSKFGDHLRALVPCEGSSEAIADQLVCLYTEAELAGSTEISADLLREWATARRDPPAPARVGAFRQRALALDEANTSEGPGEDLSAQERAVLLAQLPGGPRRGRGRPGGAGAAGAVLRPLSRASAHVLHRGQAPHVPRQPKPVPDLQARRAAHRPLPVLCQQLQGRVPRATPGHPHHAGMDGGLRGEPGNALLPRVQVRSRVQANHPDFGQEGGRKVEGVHRVAGGQLNPGLSFVLIGANISLSRKYHEDLVEAGVEGVVLYLEAPPGPIAASRAVICINSIHRVRAKMDLVGMDEMDMVLTNLNSEVMSQRGRVLSCLEAAVGGSKVVIGMDVNIDCARVMEYLFMVRPDAVLHTIRNTGLYPAERHATIRIFPLGSGLLDCIDAAVRDVLDRVARGTKVVCPSTSKRFVKHIEHDFNIENPPSESDRRGIFLHADKRSKADEEFFQKAMADPDTYLEADCVAFSPKLGPGVSEEKPYAEETVAFALNNLNGPAVETMLQQRARFRTVTNSTIYYKQAVSTAVDLPRSTEAVFQAIERDDKQIVKMLGDAAGFQFLRGSQGICDRSSASCVLYANNILAKVESYLEYVPKLKADLEKQGYEVTVERVEPTDGVGSPPPEVPLGFDAEPELLTAEEWRAKYIISSEQYEILCERPEDLSPKEQLQEFLFEMVTKEYKVDPSRVDHDFYTRFCADEDEAKATREAHANYLRFREHRFDALVADLDRALGHAKEEGVVQEYVQEMLDPVNRVPFAVRVLAFLVECREEQLNHEAERWEVSDERVQAAYAEHIGPSKTRLKTIFNLYGFVQQTSRPSQAADGKVREKKAQKRNAVGNVLRAGLGIELHMGSRSGGKSKHPHVLTPAVWLSLHERYGWFNPETVAREECMIDPRR